MHLCLVQSITEVVLCIYIRLETKIGATVGRNEEAGTRWLVAATSILLLDFLLVRAQARQLTMTNFLFLRSDKLEQLLLSIETPTTNGSIRKFWALFILYPSVSCGPRACKFVLDFSSSDNIRECFLSQHLAIFNDRLGLSSELARTFLPRW